MFQVAYLFNELECPVATSYHKGLKFNIRPRYASFHTDSYGKTARIQKDEQYAPKHKQQLVIMIMFGNGIINQSHEKYHKHVHKRGH